MAEADEIKVTVSVVEEAFKAGHQRTLLLLHPTQDTSGLRMC
jgi:hypothetical protein